MYHIVVFSKDSQAAFLWFNAYDKAAAQFEYIQKMLQVEGPGVITAQDDFGAQFTAPPRNISHCIFNDISEQGKLSKILESMGYAKKI